MLNSFLQKGSQKIFHYFSPTILFLMSEALTLMHQIINEVSPWSS